MQSFHASINQVVSDLNVLFVKLHHHHWFIKGIAFFELHEKFQDMYEEVNELYDAFAERLITIGGTPVSSLQAYLTITNIKEATTFISIQETLITIKKDYEYLIKAMKNVLTLAHAENDEATADACIGAIGKFEKTTWMVQASLS